MITPATLKGFRDFLPTDENKRQFFINSLCQSFRSHGFLPIDTPALEYAHILLGKGGGETDKQVYNFQDQGGREVVLRFDLTVPLARFVSQHFHEITFPFKRYHIAKVWRGENPQKGRYREFLQCDFDTLGAQPFFADLDTLLLVVKTLTELKVPAFKIHLSHRQLMKELLLKLDIVEKETAILRVLDKIKKIGEKECTLLLRKEGLCDQEIEVLMSFVGFKCSQPEESLAYLFQHFPEFTCLPHLKELLTTLKYLGKLDYFILDFSIMRGLDYYTGLIFETFLQDWTSLGSVCSGGRYDNLVSLYSKQTISGIGGSIGLDRLLVVMENKVPPCLDILIAYKQETDKMLYFLVAESLRELGFKSEVYAQDKKLSQQFDYAQKKGAKILLFVNANSWEKGLLSWKNVETKEMVESKSLESLRQYLNGEESFNNYEVKNK